MSQAISRAQTVALPSLTTTQPSVATALPDDLLSHALSFLSPEDLARASEACREWNKLSAERWKDFDLKKICHVIDRAVWEKHVDLAALGLDASGAPTIDKRTAIPFIKRLSSQVEGNAGVALLTMPKGLTLNKLIRLAAAPKQGPPTQFDFIWPRIIEELGDIAVDKTHTIAITCSILNNSRNKGVGVQRGLAQRNEGELPGFVQASTLAFITYVSSPEGQPPKRLYNEPSFTRCSENIDGVNLYVGGYFPEGLDALSYNDAENVYIGSAVARKF